MKLDPTAWLRAMARRQRPPATGGYINTTTTLLPISTGCDYTLPAAATKPPKAVTIEPREPTPDEVERLAAALGVIPLGPASPEQTQRLADEKAAQVRSELADRICPCVAIYSKCYYPELHGKHLQRRP